MGGDPVNRYDPRGLEFVGTGDVDESSIECDDDGNCSFDGGGISTTVGGDGTVTFGIDVNGTDDSDTDSTDVDYDDGDPVQDPVPIPTYAASVNSCVAGAAALGSVVGAGLGAGIFGTVGGFVGGISGTFVEPVGGTIVGGYVGVEIGATGGTILGTLVGGAAGALIGNIFCAEHTKNPTPSNRPKHERGKGRIKKARGPSTHPVSPPRVRPPGRKGPWPPAPGVPWH